jgi:hypothetical protein
MLSTGYFKVWGNSPVRNPDVDGHIPDPENAPSDMCSLARISNALGVKQLLLSLDCFSSLHG